MARLNVSHMNAGNAEVSIDTRTLRPGEIYVALRGEHHDGHDFVEQALAAGASVAVVEEGRAGRYPAELRPKLRPVADTLRELQAMAAAARRAWGGPLVAVTGSAGKTTTKDMIAAVLAARLRVLKNEGNLNNHIGVPLTLLRLRPEHEVAVVEMGMNHAGEIARLAEIAAPTVGVFTNVGAAHLGNFASIDGIAEAKRELARAIPASGTLILNRDDPRVSRFGEDFEGEVVSYGSPEPGRQIPLRYAGAHHQLNAAAAVAVGRHFGITESEARAALGGMEPPPGRGLVLRTGGMTLIHDCYNANPAAMEAMLVVLAQTPGRRRIAVLGEMRELGPAAPELHRQVGAAAAAGGLAALFAVAGDARAYLEGARAAGFGGEGRFFPDAATAGAALRDYLQAGDAVLFKASRAVKLENALAAVMAPEAKQV